ncbi:Protoporphyrin ferrochelatase [Saliniradius amylolyticus]|uniref:Ferrochelatase n=1 Tax=Saliniradius amylolyticus TaxID=2183582 RepID=A0A2S2E780_9ALTE|nr:ferrochelatase [Saliniradius amylolyticus]AWL13090.1 Protoporphyrin ferrochelatase [Saliniradius amylolyticus]
MKYQNPSSFSHRQADKIGVLITNLGTPDAPTKPALKRYLKEFLSDPRVVEVPRLLWWLVLNLVILNIRPKRSAEAYASVWSEQGSPLLVHTRNQAKALAESLRAEHGEQLVVDFAMRYGNPSIESRVDTMLAQGVRKLLVMPLYPQYCASTTASTFDKLSEVLQRRRWMPELRFVTQYHDDPGYIDALVNKVRQFREQYGNAQKLIFSYHGIPKRYLMQGDPYHCQCYKTTRLVAKKLGLSEDEYLTTFQSRFGREEWLKPYTDETLKKLAADGVESVQVVCPGFSADCLETIEEIGEENRDYFLQGGGRSYAYIPALNDDPEHIQALEALIRQNLQGWSLNRNAEQSESLAKELSLQKSGYTLN